MRAVFVIFILILTLTMPLPFAEAKWSSRCIDYLKKISPPLFKQKTEYTCGPAALLSWLHAQGEFRYNEQQLAVVLKTNSRTGTHYKNFVRGLKSLGYRSHFEVGLHVRHLIEYLHTGHGVLVNIQHENEGHWALLTQVDDVIRIMDPWLADTGYREISIQDFEKIWFDRFDHKLVKKGALIVAPKLY